jgi:hypothetical protein
MVFGSALVVVGLIEVIGLALSGLGLVAFGVIMVVRGYQSASVVVEDTGVLTRSFFFTRRYSFSDIDRVEVVAGSIGPNPTPRDHLVFHLADGKVRRFGEFNSPPPREGFPPTAVRRAATLIEERLAG